MFDHAIRHDEGLDDDSPRRLVRRAVRAVIRRDGRLLLVYSPDIDEYKFPGGGLEPGESEAEALSREVLEEVGAVVGSVGPRIGVITEYKRPMEAELDLFVMVSTYHEVELLSEGHEQRLDGYEAALGFEPRWVSLSDAIRKNEATMASGGPKVSSWIARDTWALKALASGLAKPPASHP